MNLCEDRHEPTLKVTYKPAPGHDYCPVWLVCGQCFEKRHFGSDEFIKSVEPLSEISA
ncbi:MAG: hypothetical protein ACW9XH_02500 [Candidatus Nitrosopumilus sp. bin_32a]